MSETKIHPQTQIGTVSLKIKRLSLALDYYVGVLGLRLSREGDGRARIGGGGPDLVELIETPEGRVVAKTTGLYHFALRVGDRVDLGHVLERVIEAQAPVVGVADHGVSEAIYLQDPDANGIEIYRDRPREEWPESDGGLQMVTEPLDVDGLLAQAKDRPSAAKGSSPFSRMGHVHLHVSDLDTAEQFYGDILGFELRQRYGTSAAFLAAGGYHHHIGLNTWAGAGAPPPPEDALGLNWYAIWLPERTSLEAVVERVRRAGIGIEETDGGYTVRDPSHNRIRLAITPSA